MTVLLCFYWFCAGLASYRLDSRRGLVGLGQFVASLMLGGVAIPVRVLQKMAS